MSGSTARRGITAKREQARERIQSSAGPSPAQPGEKPRIAAGQIGLPLPGIDIAIKDDAGNSLALGESGGGRDSSLVFDGSDVGLTGLAKVDAAALAANGDLYLSTNGLFNLGVVSGDNEDVFICSSFTAGADTACTFSPSLYFDGSLWGLAGDNVDAVNLP